MSLQPKFENVQVDVNELPGIGELKLVKLEPSYKRVRLIIWGIVSVILLIAYFCFYFFILPEEASINIFFMISIPTLIFIIGLSFIVSYYGYHQMAYALRDRDIYYKKGLIFRKTTVIPFNRIQHCEVNHGPVDRIFGLASLKIFTAGGQSSDLEVPGISEHKAHALKDFILGKTGLDEEE